MMELKVFDGNRDELERRLLKAIWLGTLEEADYLIGKLQSLPQADLRLVESNNKGLDLNKP
jgi:hypothetical protein